MYGVSVKIEGAEEAFADLTRFMRVTDQPFLHDALIDELQAEFFRAEKRQFESQGGWGSRGWAKLSPKYKAWKDRHYPGKPILRLTDALYKSLTSVAGDTIKQVLRRGKQLVLGSTVEYAEYHQKGAGTIPARPPIEYPSSQAIVFMKIVQRWVVKELGSRARSWTVGS